MKLTVAFGARSLSASVMLTTGSYRKDKVGDRIWLRYQDGTEGEVDLSHSAGKGVFSDRLEVVRREK